MLKQLIAGAEFSAQVLRQLIGDLNYNFKLIERDTSVPSNAVTADTTAVLDGAQTMYVVSTASGSRVLTLPPVATVAGKHLYVKKPSGSNSLTIDADGSETIDGATTLVLTAANSSAHLVSTGTVWLTF